MKTKRKKQAWEIGISHWTGVIWLVECYINNYVIKLDEFCNCVLQDFKAEDAILELKDGKDFDAIFILGEKSFRVHLGTVMSSFFFINSCLNN